MSQLITIARPYTKAAFEFAREHHSIEKWENMLKFASQVVCNKRMIYFLSRHLAPKVLSKYLNLICHNYIDRHFENFIKIMAENHRLMAIPIVYKQFIEQRYEYENIEKINVISVTKLNKIQSEKIKIIMERLLSKKVKLNFKIDKSIMAGLVIRIGNWVIDGSVRGRLNRLADAIKC